MGNIFSSKPPETQPVRNNPLSKNICKILLLGLNGEGKSCLLLRYTDGSYSNSYISTIGVDFKIKTISVDDEEYKLQIWDPSGEERFRTITSSYYRATKGIIIVSDITNPDMLNQATFWIKEIKKYSLGNPSIIWTGSKCDLDNERQITEDEILKFAEENELQYIETSAKDDINVDLLFTTLFCKIKNIPGPNQSRVKSAGSMVYHE